VVDVAEPAAAGVDVWFFLALCLRGLRDAAAGDGLREVDTFGLARRPVAFVPAIVCII